MGGIYYMSPLGLHVDSEVSIPGFLQPSISLVMAVPGISCPATLNGFRCCLNLFLTTLNDLLNIFPVVVGALVPWTYIYFCI